MFAKAYELAAKFTQPLIINVRYFDKSIESGLGSFVILNNEGWIMTAAHNFGASFAFNQHQSEIQEYSGKVDKINSNKGLTQGQRNAAMRLVKPNPKWVTNFTISFGIFTVPLLESYIYGDHDIAFIKIDPNLFSKIDVFPKIKKSANLKNGTSLCKLGYPFIDFKSTFDEAKNSFEVPNIFPLALFPIEGIYTRWLNAGKDAEGIDIMYIETSSPGLKGQSGGPIFDANGDLYAIQSKNITMPLGFTGVVEINKKKVEENQFLNVGIGVHVQTIETFLNKHKIKFTVAE